MTTRRLLLLAGLLALAAGPLAAQSLSLRDALARAGRDAYANRTARAAAAERDAGATATLRGILPTLRGEAGWLRTDQPLGAFAATLDQRAVTPAAFAPASLNDPAAISDWAGAAVVEVPLVNPDAWLARSSARAAAGSARAAAGWTERTTGLDVVRAYYGAVLAETEVRALEAGSAAAASHVKQARSLLDRGVVTASDALLAQVRAGEVDAQLVGARSRAELARRQLAVVLGMSADSAPALPDSLPDPVRIHAVAARPLDSADRLDVDAAAQALAAARRNATRARLQLLPRINAFGRYDWHSASAPFGGTPAWTVGVMASWTPMSGLSEAADIKAAAARVDGAATGAAAAEAQAALDRAGRESDLQVALARLDIALAAVGQGAEAHRLVARRYDGGLATVTELLDASAAETATRLRLVEAEYQAIVATAARLVANGGDVSPLTELED